MHSRYTSVLLDQAWIQFEISRLGKIRIYGGYLQIHIASDPHQWRLTTVVYPSMHVVEGDSLDRLLRTSTPFRLASGVDLVSCAEHRHMHPPSHYSNIGSTAVVL